MDRIMESEFPLTLERCLGLGRLRAAAWLDEQTVLVATQAGLWRWQPETGAVIPLARLGAEQLSINRAAGLAAVAVDCPVRELVVVALEGGAIVARLPGHGGDLIGCIALSPDGRYLASGGSDRMLRIREIASGMELLALEHPGGFSSMDGNPDVAAWSPDGRRIATACTDGSHRLWLWDAVTGARLAEWTLPLSARALSFAPDGGALVAGLDFGGGSIDRSDRFLAVIDPQTGEIRHTPDTPTPDGGRGEDVWAVAFSPEGTQCAVGDDHGMFHVFDTATWKRSFCHRGASARHVTLSGLDYSPSGDRLLFVSASEVLHNSARAALGVAVWDTRTWERVARLDDFVGTAGDLALLPDGDLLVATDEGLRRYAPDGTYSPLLSGNIHRVAAAPDGSQAVVGYRSLGEARLLDLQTGALSDLLSGITKAQVRSIAFLPDSRRYAVCHHTYWVRQVGRKTPLQKQPTREAAVEDSLSVAASSDGKLAFASWRGVVRVLWGDPLEQRTPWLAHPGPARRLNAVAFAPDGQQFAVAGGFYRRNVKSEDRLGRVFIWQWPALSVRELITPVESRWFEAIAWSPDGAWIAAGTSRGIICFFDAASGGFAGEFAAHGARITALVFAAGGRQLLSASEDGTVRRWLIPLKFGLL